MRGGVVWLTGTLLGFEKTSTARGCGGCFRPGATGLHPVWVGVVVGWSFVENCIVDASICVVKLSRANGGCLGTGGR